MKHHWFKHATYTILGIVIILAILDFIIFPLYKEHKYKKLDATYTLTQAFSEYEDILFDRTELNKKIQQATDVQKPILQREAPVLEKKLEKRSKDLDNAIKVVKKYYSSDAMLNNRLDNFKAWKDQNEAKISASTDNKWDLPFLNLQIGISNAIDKAETGYENPKEAENQKVMSLVSKAEEALKKHPNDQHLCTVMQQPLAANPKLTVQQIAFMNVGNRYCPNYYMDTSAWGGWGAKARIFTPTPSLEGREAYPEEKAIPEKNANKEEAFLNQKYGSLPYPEYYFRYVAPRLPGAVQKFQDTKQNANLCLTGAYVGGPRNPDRDALRAAFTQVGKQYCRADLIQKGYYGTGVFCLTYCDVMCSTGMVCDCVERCKLTPGVLFKDKS